MTEAPVPTDAAAVALTRELFHCCALIAYVEQACAQGGPPDPELTRRRAYRHYEQALAEKNARPQGGGPERCAGWPPS